MPVLLSLSAFDEATIRYIDFGGLQRASLGGPDQRLNRLGNRFAVDFQIGDLRSDMAEGRLLRQQLVRAKHQGARSLFPQDGLDTGTPGSPVVNGASQTGSTIVLRGFAAGYVVVTGQPFSIISGGRRYVYTADADALVPGSGNISLPITPLIRVPPTDGATCEFATPYIEGNVVSDISWIYRPGNWQGQIVSIEEAA